MSKDSTTTNNFVRLISNMEDVLEREVDFGFADEDDRLEHARAMEEVRGLAERAETPRFSEGDKVAVSLQSWQAGRIATFWPGVILSIPNRETFVYRVVVDCPWDESNEPRCVRVPDEDPDYIRDANDPETKRLLSHIKETWAQQRSFLSQWVEAKNFICDGCENPQCHSHLEHNTSGKFSHRDVIINHYPKDYDFVEGEAVLMPQRSFGNFFGPSYIDTLYKARKLLDANMLVAHPQPFEKDSKQIHMDDSRWVPHAIVPQTFIKRMREIVDAPELVCGDCS